MRAYKTSKQNVLYGNDEYIKTHTREEIMEKFNVDYNTVNNFCHKVGIHPVPARRHKVPLPEGFADFCKEHTVSQAALHFNLSYPTVIRLCKENSIPYFRIKSRTPVFDSAVYPRMRRSGLAQDMIRELSKTFTYASIARVFSYSKERVRQICMETAE